VLDEKHPKTATAIWILAEAYAGLGQSRPAITHFKAALEIYEKRSDLHYARAKANPIPPSPSHRQTAAAMAIPITAPMAAMI